MNQTYSSNTLGNINGMTLGVMGGGQLGRMFVQSAQRMGFKTVVLDPDPASPAGLIAHQHIQTDYLDPNGLEQLAQAADAITTEFENVPAQALTALARSRTVRPSADNVAICQDRAVEKAYFQRSQVPCAPFVHLQTLQDCSQAPSDLFPGIVKTAQMGYDGKGQVHVDSVQALQAAWHQLGQVRCVLEKKVALAHEISVIIARGHTGQVVHLPVQENVHQNGILSTTTVPAAHISQHTQDQAVQAAIAIAHTIDYIGVLCVEFFVLTDGQLIANEMAPRPHNSGHYSLDACDIDQYELQVRALTGLPLTQPVLLQPTVMLNLLGDIWFKDGKLLTPNFEGIFAIPGAKLHLYGKYPPKPGRKMGHITVTAATANVARQNIEHCAQILNVAI